MKSLILLLFAVFLFLPLEAQEARGFEVATIKPHPELSTLCSC